MIQSLMNSLKRGWARFNLKHPAWDKWKLKYLRKRWDKFLFIYQSEYIMTYFRGSWVRPLEQDPLKPVAQYAWPLYTNPRFNRELTKFMFSFREETSVNKNINNLMFITGPELCGKSWFLKQNLDKFLSVKSGTFLIHIDLDELGGPNFETFLDVFEGKICEFLAENSDFKFKDTAVVRWEMVRDLLVYYHDKLYLDIQIGKLLEKSVKTDDLLLLNDWQKKEIKKILSCYVDRVPKDTIIVDSIQQVIEILSEGYKPLGKNKAMTKAALDLALAFYRQEEMNSCPDKKFSGCYRTGLKTSWFLLDVLNLISGYHELNIKDLEYPHLLLVLEKAEKLLDIETNEDRPVSWAESIALKLHNDFGWRNHFPVIIEGGSSYFNTQIYDDLNIQETAFPTIEWKGVENKEQLYNMLSHIYNDEHLEFIYKHLGKNLHDVRVFTDQLIHSQEPDFYKHLELTGPGWDKEYGKFLYKISCIYNRAEVEYLLNNNTLDHAILDVVYNFMKSPMISVMGPIGEEVKQKPIIRAFLETGLLYQEKHFSYMYTRKVYQIFFKRFYKDQLKKMTKLEKADFYFYSLRKGVSTKGMDENLERDNEDPYYDFKDEADWDVDLYDQWTGKRDDPGVKYPHFIDKHSGKLAFESYGKFTEMFMIRYNLLPLTAFLDKFFNYPAAFMNLKNKNLKEGNPEPVITQPVHKWIDRRMAEYSSLPQTDSEVRIEMSPEENERAILKMAYIYDNPDKFRRPIKWRHVRRYARDVYYKSK